MSKVYCQGCFAEIPDYAHFCHLCGAPQPGDLAHDNGGSTPPTPPLASKPFDTEFAPASVGNPHSDDATLPVSRATFQTNSSANNSSSVASPARLDDAYLDTPPLVPAVSPWQTSSSPINAVSAPGNEEYSDPYYAALHTKEELDEIAAQSTILVRKDNLILPLPIQASSPQRAAHQQPQMLRAAHQQPQMLRASHQQLQSIHVVHKQPVRSMRTFFATHAQPARYSLVGMCVVLLVGLAVLLTNPFSSTNAQVNVLLSPTLTTMNATNAFPGGSITLHGINFTPGAVVAFSADGSNLSLASAQPSVSPANSANVSSLADIALSARSALLQKAALDARVQDDGTFNIALSIPQSWQANSTHRIQAKESSSGKIAFVDVKVLAQKYVAPKTVPGPTPQATSAPPPQQTQAVAPNPPSAPQQAVAPNPTQAPKPTPKPVSSNPVVQQPQAPEPTPTPYVAPQPPATPEHKPFCLSVDNDSLAFRATLRGSDPDGQIVSLSDDAACASGDWSASSDSPWLSVSPSWGHIPSGKNALIDVGTSIADLKPGSYTGHITLSPGSNVITVSLHVQVAATCISAQSSELGFTSNASYSDYSEGGWTVQQPVDKVATIENGGDCDAGSWTVTSDAKWLTVTPGTGKIDRGGSSTATVHVSAVGLNVNTPYTGHLTFDAGSSKATITVTLKFVLENQSVTPTVTPPEICLAAQTSALYFSSNVDASGPNQPKDQPATVVNGNCGAGNWTVSSDVPWLSAKGGGYIEANGTGDATVHVAPNRLDTSKEYTGHLIFVAGSSKVTIPVYLSFTIESPTPTPEQPTPAPVKPTPIPEQPTAITQPTPIPVKPTPVPVEPTPVPVPPTPIPVKPTPVPPALTQCLSVDQASLAFNGAIGYKGYDPQAQTITVTNCGSVGLVTAAVSNDSLGWLAASGGGQIASGAKTYISVSVDAIRSGLKPGPHSGIVYITVKTSDGNTKNVAVSVSFNVTATVQPAPTPVPQPTPTPVPVEPTPTPVPQPQPTPTPQPQQPQAQPTTGLRESQG